MGTNSPNLKTYIFQLLTYCACYMFFIYSIHFAMASENQTVLDLLRRLQQQNAANRDLEGKCDTLKYEVRKTEEHVSAKVALLKWQLVSAERMTVQLTNEISELEAKKQKNPDCNSINWNFLCYESSITLFTNKLLRCGYRKPC